MFLSIYNNKSGEYEVLRRLAPNESLDLEAHCKKWAESNDVAIAESDGHIPRGCADYYAQIRYSKKENGVCWTSFDFYLDYPE